MPAARRLSGWRPDAVVDLNDENDDEAERAKVAEEKREEAEKRQARSPFRETPGHQKRAALYDTYADCIKMCTENKVNEKNSWSLDLINHLGRVIDEPSGEHEMTNFQRASCTLEAGIKIYSYRVDSVYTETFKLMGGLNRTSKRSADQEAEAEAEADEDAEPGAGDTEGPGKQKKTKASKRAVAAGTAFLENPASLNMKKLEVTLSNDPLFHQTSAKFDEGGAKGLLLHNIPVQPGLALVFDSSDAVRQPEAAASAPAPRLPLQSLLNVVPRNCLELHISSDFSELHEPEPPDWWRRRGESCRGDAGQEQHIAESDAESEPEAEPDEAAAEGAGGFEPDEPFYEPPDNDDEPFAEGPDERDELLQVQQGGDGEGRLAILSLEEMAAEREAEQGHVLSAEEAVHEKAQQMLQVGQRWAGPGHWKFHAPAKPKGGEGGGGRGGRAKAAFLLDFSKGAEALKAVLAMPLEARGTTLTEAALAKASEADNTLPSDCHCSVDALCQLFHKPELRVRRGKQVLRPAQLQGDDEAQPGEASAQADAMSDGCGEEMPDLGDDWGGDGGEHEQGFEAADEPPAEASEAFELVSQPTKVAKIDIGYAKVAKQVDISALKRGLWELLADDEDASSSSDAATRRMSSEASFQQIVARLPEKIPARRLPDISISYNFICLLHLANEHGLEIVGQESLDDLRISQPAQEKPAKAKPAKAKPAKA